MTRPVLLAVASAALLAGGCGKFKDLLDPPPTEFTSPDGKWKAKFPGSPSEKSKSSGALSFTMFIKEPWNGKGGYAVGFGDLPLPANEPDSMVQKRLDDGMTGTIAGVGGTFKDSKRIFLHGRYPGREFTAAITDPKAGTYRCRMYIVGARMYQVAVMGTDDFATNAQADDFLNSFALVGESAPAHAPGGISNPVERVTTAVPKPGKARPPEPAPEPAKAGSAIHSTNGKFKARFPAAPTKGTATTDDVTFTTYAVTADGATYTTGYADRAELDGANAKQRQEALDAARDAAVADLGADAKLGKCELLVLAGRHRGWEFEATAGDRTQRARVYLVGPRLYRLTVRGSAAATHDPSVTAFFESFQVVN